MRKRKGGELSYGGPDRKRRNRLRQCRRTMRIDPASQARTIAAAAVRAWRQKPLRADVEARTAPDAIAVYWVWPHARALDGTADPPRNTRLEGRRRSVTEAVIGQKGEEDEGRRKETTT